MKGYSVLIEKKCAKAIERLPKEAASRVYAALILLKDDPRPAGSKKLVGRDGHRLRVGDYRVLYLVDDFHRAVSVYAVMHRKDVYRW